jgi:hypothetical protein
VRNVGTIEFWAKITELLRLWRGQWWRWAVFQLGMIAAIDGGSAPLHKGRKQGMLSCTFESIKLEHTIVEKSWGDFQVKSGRSTRLFIFPAKKPFETGLKRF